MNASVVRAELIAIRTRIDEALASLDRDEAPRERSPWMKPAEYAGHANVSVVTVRRWVNAGMPHTGDGRLVRINKEEADTWRSNTRFSSAKTTSAGS